MKPEPHILIKKIISGGQTGADRGGLEAAKMLGIPTGGFITRGYMTENGRDPSLKNFGLTELSSTDYEERTIRNVKESDGTVVFCKTDKKGNITGDGTMLTVYTAVTFSKPVIVNPDSKAFVSWLDQNKIRTLNVAGNRESIFPGNRKRTSDFLVKSLSKFYHGERKINMSIYLFSQQMESVRNDNYSGSATVLLNAVTALKTFLKGCTGLEDVRIADEIGKQFGLLFASHSQMAILRNFADEMFSEIKNFSDSQGLKKNLLEWLNGYTDKWAGVSMQIAENAVKHIDFRDKTVLLHSNSSTVQKIFEILQKQRIKVSILQTESRPVYEGRKQAKFLAKLGCSVTVIPDSAFTRYMDIVDMAVLGSDGVFRDYIINKIGSLSIALAFSEFRKPLYVVTDSRKVSKSKVSRKSLLENENPRPPSEVWDEKSANISAGNYYFEPVPIKYVTKLITDNQ